MKKIIFTLFITVMMLSLALISANADASGVMTKTYNDGVIVDNTWEYIESTKTLYIRSNVSGSYNETGKPSYDAENGAWSAYITEIEHIVLDGSFAKCSGEAFKNHTALKDIRITSQTTQFDGSCFTGCTNLESVTIGDDAHIPGVANLTNATILRGDEHFVGTKINIAYMANDVDTTGKNQFEAGTTVYVPKNTDAYEYFEGTGRYTLIDNSPVEISVSIDGEIHTQTLAYASDISFMVIDDDCIALYSDENCEIPYLNSMATENITLYGKRLIDYVGAMVRIEDHQGLRMIYKIDENALFGYEVKEFGALAIRQTGLWNDLDLSNGEAYKTVIYSNDEYLGKVLSIPSDGVTEYAFTAIGFEKDGAISVDYAEQNIFFRGYAVLVDTETGEEHICYTGQTKMNLADGCAKTLEASETAEKLSSDEISFVKAPLDAGAVRNYVYTKEDLISLVNTVYADDVHYIPGQYLEASSNAISRFLDRSYEETGTYPATISFDLMYMTSLTQKTMDIIEECKRYIDMGGIVSFSYHMENPTGNYTSQGVCRGELGDEAVWEELLTEETDLNKRFKEILSYAGDVLREFDKEDYPVIWRPLHEHNGGWFWWCAIQTFEENGVSVTRAVDEECFINLWRYVYNYYTVELGLDNLVWALSPNVTNSKTSPVATTYGYPGDAYCDIAGNDWYSSGNYEVNGTEKCYEALMNLSGKPAALTEFGPTGDLLAKSAEGEVQSEIFSCADQLDLIKRMMDDGLKLVYVLNWSGSHALLNLGEMDVLMQDETALDIFEVKELFDSLFKSRQ